MDYIKKFTGGDDAQTMAGENSVARPQDSTSASGGGFMSKLNGALGGGPASEKNEGESKSPTSPPVSSSDFHRSDALDKGVDWVQEHVLGQGDQSNESAIEQVRPFLLICLVFR
jgi:hypothetical protein